MPDATGLELIAQEVRGKLGSGVVASTVFDRGEATLDVAPGHAGEVLHFLKEEAEEPWDFLASLHGCDYLPAEPRLGIHWQLLSTERCDRLGVRTRVRVEDPRVPSVIDLWPTADFQEKEAYDFFGVIFDGHDGLRRILMPEDYHGHPQRRDFPIGGEPVLFTYNEDKYPRWYE